MVYRNQVTCTQTAFYGFSRYLIAGFLSTFLLLLFGCSSGTETAADCDPHIGPCTKQAGDYNVTLDIGPKPVLHMKELTFEVIFSEDSPSIALDSLVLDLSMPGMDMGKNQVTLEKRGRNRYSGTGIIVRCPSGRTLWRATVLLSENLKPAFIFNVRD